MRADPLALVRTAIEGWAEARARAERALAAGAEDDAEPVREEAQARQALGTGEVREALEEAVSLGALGPAEHGALLAHLSRAARDEVLWRAGVARPRRWDEVRALEGNPRAIGALLDEALVHPDPRRAALLLGAALAPWDADRARRADAAAQADELAARVRARGPRAPDDAPEDLATRASRWLDATDDAMREAIARAARARETREIRTVLDALRALRAPSLDPRVPPCERGRRIAAPLGALGLSELLAERARLEPAMVAAIAGARAIALDPPRRALVLPPGIELGIASELEVVRASGEALASLLVAPALPVEFRRATPASCGRALGELLAGLFCESVFLRRARGLAGAELDAFRWAAVAIQLGRARVLAARVVAARLGDRERLEGGAELLARALAARDPTMPAALADPVSLEPEGDAAAARAAWAAPAIALALRERFDEDWFRNPRSAEVIRGACARGGALSVENWGEELGADVHDAAGFWVERVR